MCAKIPDHLSRHFNFLVRFRLVEPLGHLLFAGDRHESTCPSHDEQVEAGDPVLYPMLKNSDICTNDC